MRAVRRLSILCLIAILSSCASLPDEEAPLPPEGFLVKARVAVRYGEEAASGRVVWRHSDSRDELLMSNPLGQGIVELSGRPGAYELRLADGKQFMAPDAEALTEEALGWRLPLNGLPQWIRGRALQGVATEATMDGSRYAELLQNGWQINYLAWDEARNLPQRLRLRRDDLDIRLAIEEWTLGQ
jgi:outer membrane lipoprotein LolB